MSERLSHPLMRVGIAAFVLTSCIDTNQANQPEEFLPSTPSITEPDIECIVPEQVAHLSFDSSGFFNKNTTIDEIFDDEPEAPMLDHEIVDFIDYTQPDLDPEAFANAFIDMDSTRIQKEVSVILDESTGLTEWTTELLKLDDGTEHPLVRNEKMGLISLLGNVVDVLDEYPAGFFDDIGISTLRLADTHESAAGHFDLLAGEIQLEYTHKSEDYLTDHEIHYIVAHEVGHAVHSKLCEGLDAYDTELAGDIDFIGSLSDTASQEETEAHYSKIPSSHYEYGPERVFPREYGASSVQEYFATILEFTMEGRGLIQPEDADFGSVLQLNQELVIERIEDIYPGFRDFLELQTLRLRAQDSNELYEDLKPVIITKEEIIAKQAELLPDDILVVNGLLLNGGFNRREVTLFPELQLNEYDESYSVIVDKWSNGGSVSIRLDLADEIPDELVLIPLSNSQYDELLLPRTVALSQNPSKTLESSKAYSTGHDEILELLAQFKDDHNDPIRVSFTS